jgi:hypothetical protein
MHWQEKENLARLERSTTAAAAAATEIVGSGGGPATSVGPASAGAPARPTPPPAPPPSDFWARVEECKLYWGALLVEYCCVYRVQLVYHNGHSVNSFCQRLC